MPKTTNGRHRNDTYPGKRKLERERQQLQRMTIHETALAKIYAAHEQLMSDPTHEHMLMLLAEIETQKLITGDINGKQPVGLIRGESPIKTLIDKLSKG